jgi:hypothetical protein
VRRVFALVLGVIVGAGLGACVPQCVDVAPGSPFSALTLTSYGPDRVTVSGDQSTTSLSTSGDASGTRMAWWPTDEPEGVDQISCATWTGSTGPYWRVARRHRDPQHLGRRHLTAQRARLGHHQTA